MSREDQFKVEILKKADASVLADFTVLFEQLNPDFKPPVKVKDIEAVIDFPEAVIFVIRDNKKIVASASLIGYPQIEGKIKVRLEDLIVDKQYRRQGLGKKLIKAVIKQAKRLGYKSIVFTSRPSRKIANRFDQQLGIKKCKTNVYRYLL